MTIYFNVTDAVANAATHGVTRTEQRLAAALAGRADVAFVVVRDGRLWQLDTPSAAQHLVPHSSALDPHVERFGVTRSPAARGSFPRRVTSMIASARRGASADSPTTIPIEPMRARAGDTLVSVGLDWTRDFNDLAEHFAFGLGGHFVGMCYDLIPVDHPEWLFPPDPDGFLSYVRRMARAASKVVCISECTQRDLRRHFPRLDPSDAPVLRLGADAAVDAGPEHQHFAESMFDGEPYAIYCATVDRRKNHQLLYRVMREMVRRGVPGNLLFVGRLGSGTDDLLDALRHDRAVAGRIAHVTNCDDEHLAALYARSAFAVYPSLYEGWGLGVTEALAHRKACLIASGSSLGEAGLGVCRELHPLRTGQWVDAIAEYMAHPPELPAVELPTWSSAANDLVELVRS